MASRVLGAHSRTCVSSLGAGLRPGCSHGPVLGEIALTAEPGI